MKTIIAILLAVFAINLAAAEPPPAKILTAAVLDFQVADKETKHKGSEIAAVLGAKLSASSNLILVEREELDKVLGEQELGLTGSVTAETAAKVGNLTGAKVIITGRLFEADNQFYMVAKVISTETSRVYGESVTFKNGDSLDTVVQNLSSKLLEIFDKKSDTLVAKEEDPAARIARLKKLVEGKKLPTVSVQVTEQHISHAVIDPAVQTEIKLNLQQLGFEIIDTKDGDKRADIAISGEAFSELGMRKGNLVSCRARVEIKVAQQSTGKLLLADRQTDSGIDLSEHTAGKTALQNAALKLLERIVPKLLTE